MKKIITLLAFITIQSHAAFLLEPYLNYNIGSGDSTEDGVKSDYSSSSFAFGGRVGFQNLGFMGGLDASMGSFNYDTKTPGEADYENETDLKRIGVFVGYDFPVLLRVWASYHFLNELDITKSNNISISGYKIKGNSLELGVGFTPLPLLSLNIGYRMNTFNELETPTSSETYSGSEQLKINEIFLGVSLPLTF